MKEDVKIIKEDIEIPQYIHDVPFFAEWVKYNGDVYFAMINIEKSYACRRAIIDLCYCATAGLINGRVLKTVNYNPSKFEIHKFNF